MPDTRWTLGLGSGRALYQGDLSQGGVGTMRGNTQIWSLQVDRRWSDFWSTGIQLQRGHLSAADEFYGSDDYRFKRNFSFETRLVDVALRTRFYPLGDRVFQPWVSLGVGMVFPKVDAHLEDNALPELYDRIIADMLQGGMSRPGLFIPAQFVFNFRLSPMVSTELGFQQHFLFNDYLDGVSESGNPNQSDRYGQLYVGVSLHLGHLADIDQDGIVDAEDRCPLKPGPARTLGCPDADNDGVSDAEDRCPLAKGTDQMFGCPDTDGDGIIDPYDRCPGIAGIEEALGCPASDTDKDGIQDHEDDCPLEAGPASRKGCPIVDSDFDGILDEDDRCPYLYGPALFKGCPDTDADGIEDAKDACPTVFGLFSEKGCPLASSAADEARLLSSQQLVFDPSSADLSNFALLDKIQDFLQRNPNYVLTIHGHTDTANELAEAGYLSLLRAERVKRFFTDGGLPGIRIIAKGKGHSQPISTLDTPGGHAQNRRVEFFLEPK